MPAPRMAATTILLLLTAAGNTPAGQPTSSAPAATADQDTAAPDAVSATDVSPALDDPWSNPDIAPRLERNLVRRPAAGRSSTGGSAAASGGSGAWLRTSASLAGVVALIILLAWGYRLIAGASGRFALAGRPRQPGLIEVLSRTNLAPRQTLYLVRIGPQLVLIGATHGALYSLSSIQDADFAARLAGRPAPGKPGRPDRDFERLLETEAAAYDPGAQTPAPEHIGGARVAAIKERLAHTVGNLRAVTER